MSEINEYKKVILKLAAFYEHGDKIGPEMVNFQAEVLSQWPLEEVKTGAMAYVKDTKNRFFPRPIHAIMEYAHPQDTPLDAARLAANEIWDAIGRFGWPNGHRAKERLGSLAWECVERNGGWKAVCEASGETDAGIFKAQMRDLAEALYRRAQAGKLEQAVGMPEPENKVHELARNAMKSIEGGTK